MTSEIIIIKKSEDPNEIVDAIESNFQKIKDGKIGIRRLRSRFARPKERRTIESIERNIEKEMNRITGLIGLIRIHHKKRK